VPNPYIQVALTYLRRPFASLQSSFVSVAFVFLGIQSCLTFCGGSRHDIAAASLFFPLAVAMFIFSMFVTHVADQFANWRARLTPGFHRIHATVAAAVAMLLAVLLPTLLIWLANLRSIGLAALMVLLLGALLCSTVMRWSLLSWLIVIGFFATLTEPAKMLLWQFISGTYEPQAIVLLLLGAALTLFALIRLGGWNEDALACYVHMQMRASCAGKNQMCRQLPASAGLFPRMSEWFTEKNMARCTNHARRAGWSSWSRVGRWQTGMVTYPSALVIAILVCSSFLIMVWMTDHNQKRANLGIALLMISVILPGVLGSSFWRGRIPMLGHELLLPVDRPSYIRQLGMAAVIGHLKLWTGICVGPILWLGLTAQQSFSLTDLAFVFGIGTLLQPLFFGVGVWFLRYRHLGMQTGGLVGAVYVSAIPAALYATPGPLDTWKYSALLVAGIIAVFGLLLTYDAYRRWLRTDFD
jgi:hypothetical protein